jgi:hypothetical protein
MIKVVAVDITISPKSRLGCGSGYAASASLCPADRPEHVRNGAALVPRQLEPREHEGEHGTHQGCESIVTDASRPEESHAYGIGTVDSSGYSLVIQVITGLRS